VPSEIEMFPGRFKGDNEVPNEAVLKGWRARVATLSRMRRTDKVPRSHSVAFTFGS
jgi:hypothetical protein